MRGLPFGVKRVTVLRRGPYDETWDQIVFEDNRPKRVSKRLKRAERVVRRLATANANLAVLYLERHETSNRRKSNGWLRDFRRNIRLAREDAEDRRQLMTLPGEAKRPSRPRIVARVRFSND
jgi:hypothetical protein